MPPSLLQLLRRPVAANLILAIAYAGLGAATLALGVHGGVELRRIIWVSSGVAVAYGLVSRFPLWPGAALGGALASYLNDSAPLHILGTGAANGLEVFLAVALLRRAKFDARLMGSRDILLLALHASGFAAAVAAVISVASLYSVGGVGPGAVRRVLVLWWLTHAMGIITITPVLLAWARPASMRPRAHPAEVATVLGLTFVTSWVPFTAAGDGVVTRLFFLPVAILLWAAIRLGMSWTAFGGLVATTIAMLAAVTHLGPLAVGTPNETLLLTWVFANVVITATLIAASLVEGMTRTRAEHENGERRLRAVLDAAGEGIVVADADGIVTHVNRAATAIWPGKLLAPQIGAPIAPVLTELSATATETPPAALRFPPPTRSAGEATVRLAPGRTWEVDTGTLDPAAEAEWLWSFRDVTARVDAENERRHLEAQLLHTQKLESLGVLAGGIAHDFNNLLMAIRGRAELLREELRGTPAAQEDVEGILRTSDEAAALCRQMLAYAGRGAIEVRVTDLNGAARDIADMLRVSVSRAVALEIDLSDRTLPVLADVTQIRQVLLNLVTNASDAVTATGRGGTVRVRTRLASLDHEWLARQVLGTDLPEGPYAVLEVEDDGVGMDEPTMRQIFDPFFSSKGTGRGLGLASVLGVIRSHQGALGLESAPGRGTRMTIALPIVRAPEPARPARLTPPPSDLLRGKRVLVVDDDDAVRTVTARMIRSFGAEVSTAADGDEALGALEAPGAAPLDVMLLDVTMPRRSGPATVAAMRERGLRTPVVMASGFSAEAVQAQPPLVGFLQKPYQREALERALADAVGGR